MDLLVQIQTEIAAFLDGADAFERVPVRSFRKMVISGEILKKTVWQIGKRNLVGVGCMVNMPVLLGVDENVSSPQTELSLAIDVVEQPEINFGNGGTKLEAESVARSVRLHMSHWGLEPYILFLQEATAIEPIEAGLPPGCVGYRVNLKGRLDEPALLRCPLPSISEPTPLTVTFAAVDGSLYYTIDGSLPSRPTATNGSTARLYTGAFAVAAGTVVRWQTFKAGMLPSIVGRAVYS